MLVFFQVYPDALAQAIYAVYHEAFPESERHFDDEFKQKLVYTVFEWISGERFKYETDIYPHPSPPPHTHTLNISNIQTCMTTIIAWHSKPAFVRWLWNAPQMALQYRLL